MKIGDLNHVPIIPTNYRVGNVNAQQSSNRFFRPNFFIILDEPFSGLDVGNIEEVRKTFQLLNASSEYHTAIFSTHDIELAIELAQCIYVVGYPYD